MLKNYVKIFLISIYLKSHTISQRAPFKYTIWQTHSRPYFCFIQIFCISRKCMQIRRALLERLIAYSKLLIFVIIQENLVNIMFEFPVMAFALKIVLKEFEEESWIVIKTNGRFLFWIKFTTSKNDILMHYLYIYFKINK